MKRRDILKHFGAAGALTMLRVNELPNLGLTDEFMQNMGRRNAEKLFPKLKV